MNLSILARSLVSTIFDLARHLRHVDWEMSLRHNALCEFYNTALDVLRRPNKCNKVLLHPVFLGYIFGVCRNHAEKKLNDIKRLDILFNSHRLHHN